MATFDFDDLETDDRGTLLSFNTKLVELLETRDVKIHLDYLREVCSSQAHFERDRDARLGPVVDPLYKVCRLDAAWVKDKTWALREDPEIAELSRRINVLLSFGTIGPLDLAKGDCVEVLGLESDTGRHLNLQKGVAISFSEKGRYEVRLGPDNVVNLKPSNVRKLDDREKLLSVQVQVLERLGGLEARAQLDELRGMCLMRAHFDYARQGKVAELLSPICERHGVDLQWVFAMPSSLGTEDEELAQRHKQIDELIAFCDPGPAGLDKNDCVEITGLESESGRPNNGKKALVTKWIREKSRYEVRISGDASKMLTLKQENVRKLTEREKLRSMQKQAVELLSAQQGQEVLDKHRAKCSNLMQYSKTSSDVVSQLLSQACEQHGVDMDWRAQMLAANTDDPIVKTASKRIEELASFGTLGPSHFEKGAFYEVSGLTSEAGQKMNGTAVIIRGWDEAKGRYDVSPSDNLGEMKAMRPENLQSIPDKHLASAEDAAALQEALRVAYEAPASQARLTGVRTTHPDAKSYMAALGPVLLELQGPVLEQFGFRRDSVGQQHLQRALAALEEAAPDVAQRSRDLERILGLQQLRFDGRVAIVTGGGRGLGRAYCLLLAARGAKVVVNNRTASKADEVVAEITARGGIAMAEHSNVAQNGDKVVAAALRHFGRIDIVVANAGQLEDKRFANMGLEDFATVLNTHVVGHFRLVKEAWPHFVKQKYGRIVLIVSEAGLHGHFGQLNYASAKGALLAMSQTLAQEGFKDGILSNNICTEGLTRMTNSILPPDQQVSEEELGKVQHTAAAPVAYLCHETCRATAGVFRVDGGHVQAFRWQTDEAFVDFDPGNLDTALEAVAEQWPSAPRWERVSYRAAGIHAHGFARSSEY